jgi:hypothetical protein
MFKEGADPEAPEQQKGSWYESLEGIPSLADLEAAAGIKYEEKKASKGSYTLENTVSEMKDHSLVMKIMYKALSVFIGKSVGEGKDSPEYRMMMESSAGAPLRSLMISGGIKGGAIPGLLEMANGHFFKGIARMIKG